MRLSVLLLGFVVSAIPASVTCKPFRSSDAGPGGTYFDYTHGTLVGSEDGGGIVRSKRGMTPGQPFVANGHVIVPLFDDTFNAQLAAAADAPPGSNKDKRFIGGFFGGPFGFGAGLGFPGFLGGFGLPFGGIGLGGLGFGGLGFGLPFGGLGFGLPLGGLGF